MLRYPEGLIVFGIPIVILALIIEILIRKVIKIDPNANVIEKYDAQKRIILFTRLITLGILTAIYFLLRDEQ